MEARPRWVKLRVRKVPGGVAVEVVDNGQGIPRVEHRRIFEKFYRIDDRLSREREGSGLGAGHRQAHRARAPRTVCRSTAQQGHGSTFRMILPVPAARTSGTVAAAAPVKDA